MCKDFMKELGYDSIEDIKIIKKEKTLCIKCTESILQPKTENAKKKIILV